MKIIKSDIYFETIDVLGRHVRTTKSYWNKILLFKHTELKISKEDVIAGLTKPEEVRISVKDEFIRIFYRKIDLTKFLVIVVKYLNSEGFIVTFYQTSKLKRKGKKIWPKVQKKHQD